MNERYERIEVDRDLFKFIESKRDHSKKDANTILKELLGINSEKGAVNLYDDNNFFVLRGVKFKNGTILKPKYGGQGKEVRFWNGKFHWNGYSFKYPSPLAKKITERVTDGWDFFKVKNEHTGKWEPIKKDRPIVRKRSPY